MGDGDSNLLALGTARFAVQIVISDGKPKPFWKKPSLARKLMQPKSGYYAVLLPSH